MTLTTKAALADELGITRSRVSQYVSKGLPVRPDGKLDRDEALNWINRYQVGQVGVDKGANRAARLVRLPAEKPRALQLSAPAGPVFDVLIESIESRIEGWHEIYVESLAEVGCRETVDISAVAVTFHIEPADVLVWLRAGCPYVIEGDWTSGDGFALRQTWTAEWASMVWSRLEQAGRYDLHCVLGMDKGLLAQPLAA